MRPVNKKKIANLLIVMMFCLSACGDGATPVDDGKSQETGGVAESREAELREAKLPENSLVRIEAQGGIGSGVIYALDEEELIVLTAAHVVGEEEVSQRANGTNEETTDGKQKVTVYFADGLTVESADVLCSEITDLARIKISAEKIPGENFGLYEAVKWDKESFDKLQAEDSCEATGFVDEGTIVCKEGSILNSWIYVEDYEQYMIWAKGEILPGMSGGGLFDGEGRLLGILSGGSQDGELVAVPLSLILQFSQSGW